MHSIFQLNVSNYFMLFFVLFSDRHIFFQSACLSTSNQWYSSNQYSERKRKNMSFYYKIIGKHVHSTKLDPSKIFTKRLQYKCGAFFLLLKNHVIFFFFNHFIIHTLVCSLFSFYNFSTMRKRVFFFSNGFTQFTNRKVEKKKLESENCKNFPT